MQLIGTHNTGTNDTWDVSSRGRFFLGMIHPCDVTSKGFIIKGTHDPRKNIRGHMVGDTLTMYLDQLGKH
jgi:hypothetical protein